MPHSNEHSATRPADKKAPLGACTFGEDCRIEFAEGQDKDNRFRIVAYSGGVIPDHWFWGNVAFDLNGVKFDKAKTAVLEEHFTTDRIGFTTKQDIKDNITVEGKFLSNERAQAIRQDIAEGFPMQASMYIPPSLIEHIEKGKTVEVNGHKVKGPGTIFRKARIREVSMCALGADSKTQSKPFDRGDGKEIEFNVTNERNPNMDETKIKLTAETFTADYPELFKQVTADAREQGKEQGKEEGRKEVRESFAQFAEQLKDDPGLCIQQFTKGATLDEAIKAQNEKLKEKNAKLTEAAKKQTTQVDAATQEFSDEQTGEGGSSADDSKTDEERWTEEFNKSPDIRAEFRNDVNKYIVFCKADKKGQVKIKGTGKK